MQFSALAGCAWLHALLRSRAVFRAWMSRCSASQSFSRSFAAKILQAWFHTPTKAIRKYCRLCTGMKRKYFLYLGAVLLLIVFLTAFNYRTPHGALEVSFFYDGEEDSFANRVTLADQFALWIEDAQGNVVKTLAVTDWTIRTGYRTRNDCLPVWVEKAKVPVFNKREVDAISFATPINGMLTYVWDCTDAKGKRVSDGKYTFYLENSYHWNQVMHSGTFSVGSIQSTYVRVTTRYSESVGAKFSMIKHVSAKYTAY
ncbi:MAG: hypothetical protein Ta2A_14870 [Treponemataceae bacterium]|nr:MAG: hypothetical protein Ta2A_14870 [Treponemataceae bacterium]